MSPLINLANSAVIMRSLSRPVMTLTNVAHPPIWSSHMTLTRKHTANAIYPPFTQFRLQSLDQYIDCVVTIANAGAGALRCSA